MCVSVFHNEVRSFTMRFTLTHLALVALLAAGAGTLVGCGSNTDEGDKMGDDKMGMEAPMNDSMEPMKMDGKMSDDKMADDKMGDDRMESN
jgi:hypothetical protein